MAPRAEVNPVLRARRLEIVDGSDRVRAAIAADRDDNEGDVIVGMELFDERGEARAWLVDVEGVVQLALAVGGDQVAVLQSCPDDDGPTTSLVLCDESGFAVARWSVQADGTYSSWTQE